MKKLFKYLILLLFLSIIPMTGVTTVSASDEQSITDVMRDFAKEDKLDKDTVEKTKTYFSGNIGVLISAMIYIIFAMTAFTTACDLIYIALPPMRTVLYPNERVESNQDKEQSKSYCLISRDLRNLMTTNGNNIKVMSYCKVRGISIVIIVVVLMLLVTTSVFTDLGFNIGEAILKFLGF